MAKQTFTAGQVLTATQMNNLQANDYNWSTNAQTASYVLVAADAGKTVTMTNAGATTITVNTSLFTAGDTVRILNLGAGTCTVTAGTATVNTAGSLALPQYGSGTLWFSSASAAIFIPDDRTASQGLTVVKAETAFSAVSTVTADTVFSSSYTNYLLLLKCTAASGTEIALNFRVGGVDASTNYNAIRFSIENTTLTGERRLSQTTGLLGAVGQTSSSVVATILGPQLAEATNWTSTTFYGSTGNFQRWDGTGVHTTATSYDGIKLTTSANITGTYAIYGYGKTA